jgi:hypothetical protein
MTSEQDNKKLAEIGRQLKAILPIFHGSVRFNLNPIRDYVNINLDQSVCLEYNGKVIKDLYRRSVKPNR